MTKYLLRKKVRSDLLEIAKYIERDNPSASKGFLLAAYEAFNFIADYPEAYPYFLGLSGKTIGLRQGRIPKYPAYLILYRITQDKMVEIIRIFHGSRDIPAILNLSL